MEKKIKIFEEDGSFDWDKFSSRFCALIEERAYESYAQVKDFSPKKDMK